ncbi:Dabb family protein [Flectobacillus sp. DC10W]|jgi:hypothetical protein|uniref:Dabb family protein n=1 Tax=Flectobacillus longus TaxID=2984207 RepID=A0ABT6YPH4_9BACT|nr:Dabb family protein [Flectobacillus longus]MDI9865347.1 Dabb family protein [Flectobacillus longus]
MKNTSRRSFIEKSLQAATAGTAITLMTHTSAEAAVPKTLPIFSHHVFFWLKDNKDKKAHDQLLAGLKGLGKIEQIKQAHIGKASINDFDKPVTDASYTFSVLLLFASKEDEEKYLVHPLHKKFIEDNKHLWSKVVVYDSIAL